MKQMSQVLADLGEGAMKKRVAVGMITQQPEIAAAPKPGCSAVSLHY